MEESRQELGLDDNDESLENESNERSSIKKKKRFHKNIPINSILPKNISISPRFSTNKKKSLKKTENKKVAKGVPIEETPFKNFLNDQNFRNQSRNSLKIHIQNVGQSEKVSKKKLSNNSEIINKPEKKKQAGIFELDPQKVEKPYIDHLRTLQHHQQDPEFTNFTRAMLRDDPRAYESSLGLLHNTLNVVHLALFQIAIPSLPHSPTTLLIILWSMELLFYLLTLIPCLIKFRFMSWFKLTEKTFKFIFMESFFGVCLMISLKSNRDRMPVNKSLQEIGIYSVIFGIIVNYCFVFGNIVISIIKIVKIFKDKKSTAEKDDLTLEKRGLIYYTDKKQSSLDDPEVRKRKKIRPLTWRSFSRLRYKRWAEKQEERNQQNKGIPSTKNQPNSLNGERKAKKILTPFKFLDHQQDDISPPIKPKEKTLSKKNSPSMKKRAENRHPKMRKSEKWHIEADEDASQEGMSRRSPRKNRGLLFRVQGSPQEFQPSSFRDLNPLSEEY